MSEKRCANCRYFEEGTPWVSSHVCRIELPPWMHTRDVTSRFVASYDWCDLFQPKEGETA